MVTLLDRNWRKDFANVLQSTYHSLIISSPYITPDGSEFILSHLPPQVQGKLELRILTDFSPINICQGSTDPHALRTLATAFPRLSLIHLPKLHAKVYVSDTQAAIVTSANLTFGGLVRNYEYGIKIKEPTLIRTIASDITDFSNLGALISIENLDRFCNISSSVSQAYRKSQNSVIKSLREEFKQQLLTAEDELIRMRLAGGSMHTVFEKTILYLLKRYGPQNTEELHLRIESIHPDLCDNSIDRIIDGKHFGKKWKHAVRTAQQQLKRKGFVVLNGRNWTLTK
ncbi:MAG: phospholipase D-like domain-containing protein [Phycisphaerae bacterium]|jgi:HKD family nuclease